MVVTVKVGIAITLSTRVMQVVLLMERVLLQIRVIVRVVSTVHGVKLGTVTVLRWILRMYVLRMVLA
jgi:hypothetical protein